MAYNPMNPKALIEVLQTIADTVQKENKEDPVEATAPESVFKKMKTRMKDAVTKDDFAGDEDFEEMLGKGNEDDIKEDIKRLKEEFKLREEQMKLDYEKQLDSLQDRFRKQHDQVKKQFKSQAERLNQLAKKLKKK